MTASATAQRLAPAPALALVGGLDDPTARRAVALRRGPKLELYRPATPAAAAPANGSTTWYINGFPGTVRTWTPEQWAALADRPPAAQIDRNGVRVLLSMDDAHTSAGLRAALDALMARGATPAN